MYITPVNNQIYFQSNVRTAKEQDNEKRKISGSEAAVVTGAAGATGSAVAGQGSLKSFSSVNKKINSTAKNVKNSMELASETGVKAKSIFGKMAQNCTKYRNSIIEFGQNISKHKLLKPILTSKAYKGAATVAGGATAGFVAISGIGEMFSTFAKKAEQLSRS